MKALKNESAIFTGRVVGAIADCYHRNPEPADAELMELYAEIGKCICEQGEKAYVVHLAQTLAERFPMLKGFSPRNLRRMRDFYRAYENSASLMEKARALNWTQNTIILECCEVSEQRAFYISLAAEQNLSKLALMKAIEAKTFESAQDEAAAQNVTNLCAAVSDCPEAETVDTYAPNETACGAFVTACEPLRQGDGLPAVRRAGILAAVSQVCGSRLNPTDEDTIKTIKRSSHAVRIRPPGLLPKRMGCSTRKKLRIWAGKHPLAGRFSLPRRWLNFEAACLCAA